MPETATGLPARGEGVPSLRRRFAFLVAAAVLVWLAVMLVGGESGALALLRARAKLEALEARAAAIEAENRRLQADNRSLESDDRVIVRLAREDLMMGRPDEEVLLVPDPKALAAEAERARVEAAAARGPVGAPPRPTP